MGTGGKEGKIPGSYVRSGLQQGLLFRSETGVNPYQMGLVGGSDSHNASTPVEENSYSGKIGRGDDTARKRREGGSITSSNLLYSAAGLTGVWAESNTREAIFSALRRRETFATSGSRIRLRLLADWQLERLGTGPGYNFDYLESVPMGGELHSGGRSDKPHFLAWAASDPRSAPLQRIQMVKGWLRGDGQLFEKVIDIACPAGVDLDRKAGRCADTGARVDLSDCSYDRKAGADELQVKWTDNDFNPDEQAFYYLRVIENPSCRWSTWDAIRNGWEPPAGVPSTLQERAWSSPIWYAPT